jgi:hypothetical protein
VSQPRHQLAPRQRLRATTRPVTAGSPAGGSATAVRHGQAHAQIDHDGKHLGFCREEQPVRMLPECRCPLSCLWRSGCVHDRAHASPSAARTAPWARGCSVIHIQAPGKPRWPQAPPLLASHPAGAATVGRPRR